MKDRISVKTIEDMIKSDEWIARKAAAKACKGRKDIPVELIIDMMVGVEDEYTRGFLAKEAKDRLKK